MSAYSEIVAAAVTAALAQQERLLMQWTQTVRDSFTVEQNEAARKYQRDIDALHAEIERLRATMANTKQRLIDRIVELDGFAPYYDDGRWMRSDSSPDYSAEELYQDECKGSAAVGLCHALDFFFPEG